MEHQELELRLRSACKAHGGAGSSEDGAEELLLPEGVFRGRDGDDERVLSYVCVAVRHQIRRRLRHLTHTDRALISCGLS